MKVKMKYVYKLQLVSLLVVSLMTMTSCEIETSDNGKLDGYWHLVAVDTLSTGGRAELGQKRLFWAVQHKLIRLQNADYTSDSFYLRFSQTGDSLKVFSPYADHGHEDMKDGGDIPVTDAAVLSMFGVSGLEDSFLKESLNGSRMILKSKTYRLYFKRF